MIPACISGAQCDRMHTHRAERDTPNCQVDATAGAGKVASYPPLDLLFPEEGVSNVMIIEDAKELIGGAFCQKMQTSWVL
jgi:hypothetical protein